MIDVQHVVLEHVRTTVVLYVRPYVVGGSNTSDFFEGAMRVSGGVYVSVEKSGKRGGNGGMRGWVRGGVCVREGVCERRSVCEEMDERGVEYR